MCQPCISFAANLLFAFSTNDFPAWLAAYCILGVGGVMVYISQFYLAAYFPGVCVRTDLDSILGTLAFLMGAKFRSFCNVLGILRTQIGFKLVLVCSKEKNCRRPSDRVNFNVFTVRRRIGTINHFAKRCSASLASPHLKNASSTAWQARLGAVARNVLPLER
jgi:hypothetical protein